MAPKGNAGRTARALMTAGMAMANHPPSTQINGALSPLVQSLQAWAGGGNEQALPRPPGVFSEGGFTPLQPMIPMAIDQPDDDGVVEPRRTQAPVGWNLPTGQPGSEGLGKLASFATLRAMADTYSVARRCIQKRKEEVIGWDWDIIPTKEAEEAMKGSNALRTDWQARHKELMSFMERPDRSPDSPYGDWAEWMEAFLEDRYVIDAVALYMHGPLGGKGKGWLGSDIGSIDLIDGSTIRPLYEVGGGTPPPSTPAYQQFLWGVPRSDYTTMVEGRDLDEIGDTYVQDFRYRELMYIRNVRRTWAPYGNSPVEQVLTPIALGLARQNGQLQWWTEGSVPYLYVVPGAALIQSPQQVRQLQNALNAVAGDSGWKQKVIVLPPDSTMAPVKDSPLSDEFDEYVISLVAMGWGYKAQDIGMEPKAGSLRSQGTSAATASANQTDKDDWSKAEAKKLKALHDYWIRRVFKQEDMEFVFTSLQDEEDEHQERQDAIALVKGSIAAIDEGRKMVHLDALGLDETSVPLIFTATGALTVSEAVQQGSVGLQQSRVMLDQTVNPPELEAGANKPSRSGATHASDPQSVDSGGKPTSPAHEAASAVAAKEPKAPTAAKAQLAELDALKRLLTKGKQIQFFEPRHLSGSVLHAVEHSLHLGIEKAIAAGTEEVGAVQRTYLAEMALAKARGEITAERLAFISGQLASEGVVLKVRTDEDPTTDDVYEYLSKNYPESDLGWVRECAWSYRVVPLLKIDATMALKGHDAKKIHSMVEDLKQGGTMHPLVLVNSSKADMLTVADGRHRTIAAFVANRTEVPAWVGEPTPDAGEWRENVVDMHEHRMNKAAAGEERHPEDTERLKEYWAHGEGAEKIGWGTDGDFDRCRAAVAGKVPAHEIDGYCANLHHRATGAWPGHAAGEEEKYLDGDVFKVGPKGYIHGWIFVGIPEEGARVFHPGYGHGTTTRVRDFGNGNRNVSVKWDSGHFSNHEAREANVGETPGFVPRDGVGTEAPQSEKPKPVPIPPHTVETPSAPQPDTDEHYRKIEDDAYHEASSSERGALDVLREAFQERKASSSKEAERRGRYVHGEGFVAPPHEEQERLRMESATHMARSRGLERAGNEKDKEEGKAFKLVDGPSSGWKKMTAEETVQHMTARAIASGTKTLIAHEAAKKYATNHEVHLLHDGSIVSVKKGTLPTATRAADLKETLDTMESLRNAHPNREPHYVSIGESVTGQRMTSLGNAYAGVSRIGVAKSVFHANRGITPLQASTGHWMPEAANHSTLKVVLAHEFGHTLDDEGKAGGMRGGSFGSSAGRSEEAARILREQRAKGEISKYGMTNAKEQYAESFAEFALSKGTTTNQSVLELARVYGWKVPQ